MPEKRYRTFEEFWPFYVSEHSNPLNRRLHFVGTTLALVSLIRFGQTGQKNTWHWHRLWGTSLPGWGILVSKKTDLPPLPIRLSRCWVILRCLA